MLRPSMVSRVALFTLSLLSVAILSASKHAPTSCPVTKGNGYTPAGEPAGPDRYGTRALSTILYGTLEFRPGGAGFVLPDGSLKMKWPWWKEKEGNLTITGRRLDGSAPPLRADVAGSDGYEMVPTYIIFPTTGCWEVTGKVGNATLTFVTRVVKIGRGP
jgi:hypothetical protein